jgi:NADH-quinone oxidoreductase subunit A
VGRFWPESGPGFALPSGAPVFNFPAMNDSQFGQYLAVLMLLVLAVAATGGMIFASMLVGKRGGHSKIKDTAYECGMLPEGSGSPRLSVKFYLVAILFVLFDIEVVFLYPWSVVYKAMVVDPVTRNLILGSMISFLGILFVGYLYALKKGAFDWKS